MFGDYHADHDSVLFATNIARDNTQRDNLNPLRINMRQGKGHKVYGAL